MEPTRENRPQQISNAARDTAGTLRAAAEGVWESWTGLRETKWKELPAQAWLYMAVVIGFVAAAFVVTNYKVFFGNC